MKNVDPKAVKLLRRKYGLSQQALAELSRVSKKTIARIEGGKTSANNTTVSRLAEAFKVSDQELAKSSGQFNDLNSLGWRKFRPSYLLHENASLAMQMVEKCYGISIVLQLRLAPLMAALLAEGSLAWRRQKLAAAEEATNMLREADFGHVGFHIGAAMAEHFAEYERDSIEHRDISGKEVLDEVWKEGGNPGDINPFVEYLCDFARELAKENGSDLVKVFSEPKHDDEEGPDGKWLTDPLFHRDHRVYFSIDANELDRLVGDSEWAGRALQWGCVRIADIPKELLGDDVKEERMRWLESQIPEAKRAEYEAYWDSLPIITLED